VSDSTFDETDYIEASSPSDGDEQPGVLFEGLVDRRGFRLCWNDTEEMSAFALSIIDQILRRRLAAPGGGRILVDAKLLDDGTVSFEIETVDVEAYQ